MKKFLIALLIAVPGPALAEDRFENIRDNWPMCQTCHGQNGEGGIGPKLAGQSADDIISKLMHYKAGHKLGSQSSLMIPWAQSLNDGQIGTFGVFVQEGFPNE